jgi:hypothetical protein
VKEDEMDRACSTSGAEKEFIEDIGGKARRKETTRKTKGRKWVDNIKIDFREVRWDDMDLIDLAQDR